MTLCRSLCRALSYDSYAHSVYVWHCDCDPLKPKCSWVRSVRSSSSTSDISTLVQDLGPRQRSTSLRGVSKCFAMHNDVQPKAEPSLTGWGSIKTKDIDKCRAPLRTASRGCKGLLSSLAMKAIFQFQPCETSKNKPCGMSSPVYSWLFHMLLIILILISFIIFIMQIQEEEEEEEAEEPPRSRRSRRSTEDHRTLAWSCPISLLRETGSGVATSWTTHSRLRNVSCAKIGGTLAFGSNAQDILFMWCILSEFSHAFTLRSFSLNSQSLSLSLCVPTLISVNLRRSANKQPLLWNNSSRSTLPNENRWQEAAPHSNQAYAQATLPFVVTLPNF